MLSPNVQMDEKPIDTKFMASEGNVPECVFFYLDTTTARFFGLSVMVREYKPYARHAHDHISWLAYIDRISIKSGPNRYKAT